MGNTTNRETTTKSQAASGEYDLSKLIKLGTGTFGNVYKLNNTTAVKVLAVGADEKLKTDALNEIQFMLNIMSETGPGRDQLLNIHGYDDLGDRICIKIALAEFSMASFMTQAQYKKISPTQKRKVMEEGFAGLDFLHSRSPPIIHQDIKKNNILLFPGLHVKISDFRLARFKSHASVTWMSAGIEDTLVSAYTAPEVLIGVNGGKRMMPQTFSDIWSMCCTGVEWFVGEHPWSFSKEGDLTKQRDDKQRSHQLPDKLQHVPKNVADILEMGLHYDYGCRPSAAQMRDMLAGKKNVAAMQKRQQSAASSQSAMASAGDTPHAASAKDMQSDEIWK